MNAGDGETTRLQWFKDAKFGMFVHWGPYSALAGEWDDRRVPVGMNAEWIMHTLHIPRDEYRKIAAEFRPAKFDADEWADLAQRAGMRYLAFTSKHHDGFAMYRSEVSDYNIMDYAGFDRDPVQELADAFRKRGIRFGLYYSHREDWDEPCGYGNTWDFDFDQEAQRDEFEQNYLYRKAEPQVRELLTRYGPVDLLWFDRGLYTPEQGQHFYDLVRSLQPGCLINGRVGSYDQDCLGDYQDLGDNEMPIGGIEELWESPQTLNETWGYSRFDDQWREPAEIVERLANIVSRGGNYILNIGPRGDGSIPEESVRILKAVGEWLSRNGESIYGTTASPLPAPEWGYITARGATLYLHIVRPPDSGIVGIDGLRTRVVRAAAMCDPQHECAVQQDGSSIRINLGSITADPFDTVVRVELEGPPTVDPPVAVPGEDGVIELGFVNALTSGRAMKRYTRKGKFHIAGWRGTGDSVTWHVAGATPGAYAVTVRYAGTDTSRGRSYTVATPSSSTEGEVEYAGGWFEYLEQSVGNIALSAGSDTVTVHPAAEGDSDLMYLQGITLHPRR